MKSLAEGMLGAFRKKASQGVAEASREEAEKLGIDTRELRGLKLARRGLRQQLLQMGRLFGLSEEDIGNDPKAMLDLDETCTKCVHSGGCRSFLASQDTPFKAKDCPNAALYIKIASNQKRPH